MFGKKHAHGTPFPKIPTPQPKDATGPGEVAAVSAPASGFQATGEQERSEQYYAMKAQMFAALLDTIDVVRISEMEASQAREEIKALINDIATSKKLKISIHEQEQLYRDICNDMLGYGPLEPLLARDDISDIMVNGTTPIFIEVDGKIEQTDIRFKDNKQLLNICQRIVSQVGRRVDESSPICDARLADGSRVNVIAPPLSIDGPSLTIRKFKRDKLTLDQITKFGSVTPEGAEILKIIGRVRCNVVISGGTGSENHPAELSDPLYRP